jgi:Raf kinase inhibitor-like YbhB/YbcL family protein
MGIAHKVEAAVGHTLEHVHAGEDKLASRKAANGILPTIHVRSSAFHAAGPLPVSSTADGEGVPPPLTWEGVPAQARSIAVVCEDPDAPFPEPFVHWMVYGIPATVRALDGSTALPGKDGKNSTLATGFTGAAPPVGHGIHHYHFQVFALDIALDLEPGVGRGKLLDAMKGHVLAFGELVGTYERK